MELVLRDSFSGFLGDDVTFEGDYGDVVLAGGYGPASDLAKLDAPNGLLDFKGTFNYGSGSQKISGVGLLYSYPYEVINGVLVKVTVLLLLVNGAHVGLFEVVWVSGDMDLDGGEDPVHIGAADTFISSVTIHR